MWSLVGKADLIYEKPDIKKVLNMLKVNFRHVSGFGANFTAHIFVCEKVSVMPNENNSTLFRQYLESSIFLGRLTVILFRVHKSQQDKNF